AMCARVWLSKAYRWGAPPGRARGPRRGVPPPFRPPGATAPPPRKDESYAKNDSRSNPSGLNSLTCGAPPTPAPTTTGRPCPGGTGAGATSTANAADPTPPTPFAPVKPEVTTSGAADAGSRLTTPAG